LIVVMILNLLQRDLIIELFLISKMGTENCCSSRKKELNLDEMYYANTLGAPKCLTFENFLKEEKERVTVDKRK
jgi:hypothetical protein